MALSFGPSRLPMLPADASGVSVTTIGGTPVTLVDPVAVDGLGRVSFSVSEPGLYRVIITDADGYGAAFDVLIVGLINEPINGTIYDYIDDGLLAAGFVKRVNNTPPDVNGNVTIIVSGEGGTSDHGALTGLEDDDHPQYALADGSRGDFAPTDSPTFTGTVTGITKTMVGLSNVDNTSDLSKPVSSATATAIASASTNDRNRANHNGTQDATTTITGLAAVALSGSYADLTGTIPTSALPPLAINETFTVASQAAMLALVAQRGDVAIRTDTSQTYILSSDSPSTLADWKEMIGPGAVTSVAGRTGAVTLTKSDVGLSNVDNTSDANKPISTATQTALDLKAPLASPAFTGTVTGVTKTMVGLGNVDNTSDASKPVSTAQAAALAAKVSTTATASRLYATDSGGAQTTYPFDATATASTIALRGAGGVVRVGTPVSNDDATPKVWVETNLATKAPLESPTFTGTITVPDDAFGIAKVNGLQAALDARGADLAVHVYYTGSAWPARPTLVGSQYVYWDSAEYVSAPQPTMVDRDRWLPHPDSAIYDTLG